MTRTGKGLAIALELFLAAASSVQAASYTETFDSAPTGWTVDRYAPAGFTAPVSFDGGNRLKLSISSADSAANRSSTYSSGFYNTQGMAQDNPSGIISESIDFYLPASQISSPDRYFGLWGVGYDASSVLSTYPIIEYANGGLRFWDSAGSWNDVSSASIMASIVGDQWINMGFYLDTANDKIDYTVNHQLVGSVAAYGTTSINSTILQGYNAGTSYDVYADNLVRSTTAPVPLPATLPMLGFGLLGFGLLGARRKRRQTSV